MGFTFMGDTGLEPVTPSVSCWCASQLRQSPGFGRLERREDAKSRPVVVLYARIRGTQGSTDESFRIIGCRVDAEVRRVAHRMVCEGGRRGVRRCNGSGFGVVRVAMQGTLAANVVHV